MELKSGRKPRRGGGQYRLKMTTLRRIDIDVVDSDEVGKKG
jgi:hypothetical protein